MNKNLKKLTLSALLASLIFIMTRYIAIPTAIGGYINGGDAIVLLSGLILGPIYGLVTAAFGSAFADLISPYAIYTPATFIIKGLMAFTVAHLFELFRKVDLKTNIIFSSVLAEIIMIVGYFIFEAYILEFGVIVAGYETINNLIQAASSVALVTLIYLPLSKSTLLKSLMQK